MKLRPRRLNSVEATLFMIGSTCFAIGVVPAYVDVVGETNSLVTFVVGSVFFTLASLLQLLQVQSPGMEPSRGDSTSTRVKVRWVAWLPHDLNWLAAVTQFPGTLFFNVTTTAALITGLTASQQDQQVWRPDFLGSCLFLLSSAFAARAYGTPRHRWHSHGLSLRIAQLNLFGSVAFMVSAVGSFILRSNGSPLNAGWASTGTFLGAVGFFLGAALMPIVWNRIEAGETEAAPETETTP